MACPFALPQELVSLVVDYWAETAVQRLRLLLRVPWLPRLTDARCPQAWRNFTLRDALEAGSQPALSYLLGVVKRGDLVITDEDLIGAAEFGEVGVVKKIWRACGRRVSEAAQATMATRAALMDRCETLVWLIDVRREPWGIRRWLRHVVGARTARSVRPRPARSSSTTSWRRGAGPSRTRGTSTCAYSAVSCGATTRSASGRSLPSPPRQEGFQERSAVGPAAALANVHLPVESAPVIEGGK